MQKVKKLQRMATLKASPKEFPIAKVAIAGSAVANTNPKDPTK